MDDENILYDETDSKSIERYAKQLIGKTFKDIICNEELNDEEFISFANFARKGGLGNLVEKHFFQYDINSNSEADFEKAGVELKVTPYEMTKKNTYKAGERLVLTMISNTEPVEDDFYKSHLWQKCRLMLLIFYLRDRLLADKLDYGINFVGLFEPVDKDLEIIINDYQLIIDKIKSGKAHELSEGDTLYLGACTKGATAASSMATQYYNPDVPAKRRAFAFKQSYMTYVLNNYYVGKHDVAESILTDTDETDLGKVLADKIKPYIGKTESELCQKFDLVGNTNKAKLTLLVYRMLGVSSNQAEEFLKANIVVKTIRVEKNRTIKESMSFPAFKFKEIIEEEWEESALCTYFEETKLFFVVYVENEDGEYVLQGVKLWNMPADDRASLEGFWKNVQSIIREGVELIPTKDKYNNDRIKNNLPGKNDHPISHVRAHSNNAYYKLEDGTQYGKGKLSDADELPDGRFMTKQCFWLNNTYILSVIKDLL